MEESAFWSHVSDVFDTAYLSEWLQSVDLYSALIFVCGLTLFYLVMSMALRILSLLFWPTVVIVGLLFIRNESFATLITESVKQISQAALTEILPEQ